MICVYVRASPALFNYAVLLFYIVIAVSCRLCSDMISFSFKNFAIPPRLSSTPSWTGWMQTGQWFSFSERCNIFFAQTKVWTFYSNSGQFCQTVGSFQGLYFVNKCFPDVNYWRKQLLMNDVFAEWEINPWGKNPGPALREWESVWNLAEASRQCCLCSLSSTPLPRVQVT